MTPRAPDPRTAGEWFARLNDAPTDEDRVAFRAWIERDPGNLDAYRRAERDWALLGLTARAAEIKGWRGEALGRHPAAPSRRWLMAAGGGVAAAVLAGAVWLTAFSPTQVYATAAKERLSVALPDGSQVALAPGARLKVRYAVGERRLDLERGQAYFVVAHAADRPFRVHAGDRVVTALGTQFQVRRDASGGAEVILAEGRVSVASGRGEAGRPTVLEAGQKLAADAATPGAADVQVETAWRSGRLVFRDRRLDEVVEEFNRWSATPIVVGDPQAAATRISGTFDADSARDFGRALTEVFDLRVSIAADGALLIRSPAPRPSSG